MAYGPEAKYLSNLNFSVYQAPNGFLWIGTQNGLVRFDGKRYKNFYADYANPNSPSDNTIMDIIEDKNGELWFTGFYYGVTRYNQKTGRFRKYPRLSNDHNDYYGIYSGLKDSEGNLWFCTAGRGLARYLYEKDSFALYYPEPDRNKDGRIRGDNYVTSVCEDPSDKNILWCSSFHGLFSFDKATGQFRFYTTGLLNNEYPDILINDLEFDNRGNLWAGTWGYGLLCFNTQLKKFEAGKARKSPGVIYHIKQVSDSLVYMAAMGQGLWQYNLSNNSYTDITPPGYQGDPSTSNPGIERISVTPKAGVFISGNYYLYQQHSAFLRLQKNVAFPDQNSSKTKIFLEGFLWDPYRKKYWISTFAGNGLYALSEDFRTITPISHSGKRAGEENYFLYPVIDARKRVWVINVNSGLNQFNDKTNSFGAPVDTVPLADSFTSVPRKIKTDTKGNIWMISQGNFIYWDVSTDKTEFFPIQWSSAYKSVRSLKGELEIDPDGNAWLITEGGLFYCNRQQKSVEHIFKTGSSEADLSSYTWSSGSFDKYKGLWLTAANGIQVYDWKSRSVLANHNTDGGLPTMRAITIKSDTKGRIYAATAAGLTLFDPSKKVWQLFNRYDGLGSDYLDNKLFITSNNKIVIDQENGFVIKDVEEITSGNVPPLLNLTSLLINEKEYLDTLMQNAEYRLSFRHSENNIRITFGAMDWLYPFRTTYWYTIEGSESSGPLFKSEEAQIDLAGLQPGKYVIRIKALSGNSLWSNEIELPITIKPPFWKTTWFMALCSLAALAIIFLIYRYRLNQYKKLQKMRNNIARDLHDDIGASLSNISILNELAKRHAGDVATSKEYLSKAGEDIQHISESLSDIVWNINPRYDEIENLFIRMKRYAADMMDGKNISYEITFPEKVTISLPMEKRRDLYMIFKEAINNLAKYSKATRATIVLNITHNKVLLQITDNGKGFVSSATMQGNGLVNMKQRADKWGAELKIDSAPGKGTSVILEMKA